jgi:hypothetical protein
MTPVSEAVERLRAVYTKTDHRFGEFEGDCINPDGPKAAALIEALADEIARLRSDVSDIMAANAELATENTALAEQVRVAREFVAEIADTDLRDCKFDPDALVCEARETLTRMEKNDG